jgi:hypothetical protein
MTNHELVEKMLAFIESQDGEDLDEWYATNRDFSATVLLDFARYMGLELVVPEYIPRKDKRTVNREELLRDLLPHIQELFNMEYDKRMKESQ